MKMNDFFKNFLWLAILFILIFTPTEGKTFSTNHPKGIWPFFLLYDNKVNILGPFISLHLNKGVKSLSVRPLFSYEISSKEDYTFFDLLYPIIRYRKFGERSRFLFFPLSDVRKDGNEKIFSFFPITFGTSEENERYFAFFPFYGRLYHRFGQKKIHFILWPLYTHMIEEEAETYKIFWPFFRFTKGKLKKGVSIWPLWGEKIKRGKYEKEYIFWPFFTHQRLGLDTDNPRDETYFLFLYGKVDSPFYSTYSIFWPFFSYTESIKYNFHKWDIPWPLISFAYGKSIKKVWFFPLFGFKRRPDFYRYFFLWPLYNYEKETGKNGEVITKRILFLSKIKDIKTNKKDIHISAIWPFFYYYRDQRITKLKSFYFLPISNKGVDRNLSPLYEIFQYKEEDGIETTELFWGLLWGRKKSNSSEASIASIIDLGEYDDGFYISLLKGLFTVYRRGNVKKVRLIYFLNFKSDQKR